MTLRPELLRADFPQLARTMNGRPLVYLDSAATAQKPRQVLDAVRRHYEEHNANARRGIYALAEEATAALESARESVRAFLGAASPAEIVFTRGTTDSINLVAQGWATPRLRPGDEILLTELEHHANLLPWQRVAQKTGAVLRFLPVDARGELPPDTLAAWDSLLGPRTRLVAFSHVSNALGTLLPAADLARAARARGIAVLIDAAQSAGHLPLDVRALGCDFLAFSAHKALGPTGLGVLYGRSERLEELEPVTLGGGIVREVSLTSATFSELPHRLEPGTQPVAEACGLQAALAYLQRLDPASALAHARALTARALEQLSAIPGLQLYGPPRPADLGSAISFNLEGIHPHDLAAFLDSRGIAVRAGTHCAQPLMHRLSVPGTVRASFHLYTLPSEVDVLAQALSDARKQVARGPSV